MKLHGDKAVVLKRIYSVGTNLLSVFLCKRTFNYFSFCSIQFLSKFSKQFLEKEAGHLLGPVHMEVRYPPRWGYQSLHVISLYFLIAFTCEVGYLTEAGNPLSWGEFFHVNAGGGVG